MSIKELFDLLRWDWRINHGWSFDNIRARLILSEVRFEQFVYRNFYRPGNLLSSVWYMTRFFCSIFQWFLANSNIPGNATIGRGLRLPHPQNIIVARFSKIGEFCTIYQNVSITWNGFLPIEEVKNLSPKIGDKVLLGAGCIILGDVTIGSDVVVSAGAVILRSVPDHARVVCPRPVVITNYPTRDPAEPGSERHIRDPFSLWR